MNMIMTIACNHNLLVIEDAAQGVMATYKGRPLGSIGDLGCYSFHEKKNIISGEGGALLVNNPAFADRAEIIREKGTNRSRFFRGQVDKYTWVDIGSSYLPGELIAAFLWAQMEEADPITARQLSIWARDHEAFHKLESIGRVRRPAIPECCKHNAHIYQLLLRDIADRATFIEAMKAMNIKCVFHYIPLHNSPSNEHKLSRTHGEMVMTNTISETLVRAPLWAELEEVQDKITSKMATWLQHN